MHDRARGGVLQELLLVRKQVVLDGESYRSLRPTPEKAKPPASKGQFAQQ